MDYIIYLDEESKEFQVLKKEWDDKAKSIKSIDELSEFCHHLMEDYNHDYGTCVRAIAAMSLAAAWMGAHIEGITGFQAGFVMWDFITGWIKCENQCGLKLLDYDHMLYPQYMEEYEKYISRDTFKKLQEKAKEKLEEYDNENRDLPLKLKEHWESIVKGIPPFGYKISEEDY